MMKTFIFFILIVLAVSASSTKPQNSNRTGISLQTQISHSQETNKETIRHGKKKRIRMKNNRGKKHGSARRNVEKHYLVQKRTLALLGDEVQKILDSSKTPFQFKNSTNYHVEKIHGNFDNSTRSVKRNKGRKKSAKVLNTLNTNSSQTENEDERSKEDKEYDWDLSLKEDVQFNLNDALIRIISAIENFTVVHSEGSNSCEKLAICKEELQNIFLGSLPDCPCNYPTGIFYENRFWDQNQKKYFRWKDASNERLDIYKSGAEYCIRSQIDHGSTSLSAQHCCYDKNRNLITRGSGAGSPNYVSPDISVVLHDKIDILPWRICKGDFTRFNKVRPPNNGNLCQENPNDEMYNKLIQITTSY